MMYQSAPAAATAALVTATATSTILLWQFLQIFTILFTHGKAFTKGKCDGLGRVFMDIFSNQINVRQPNSRYESVSVLSTNKKVINIISISDPTITSIKVVSFFGTLMITEYDRLIANGE